MARVRRNVRISCILAVVQRLFGPDRVKKLSSVVLAPVYIHLLGKASFKLLFDVSLSCLAYLPYSIDMPGISVPFSHTFACALVPRLFCAIPSCAFSHGFPTHATNLLVLLSPCLDRTGGGGGLVGFRRGWHSSR